MPSFWRRLLSRGISDHHDRKPVHRDRGESPSASSVSQIERRRSRFHHEHRRQRTLGYSDMESAHTGTPSSIRHSPADGWHGSDGTSVTPSPNFSNIVPRDELDSKGRRMYDRVLLWAYQNDNDCSTQEAADALVKDGRIEPLPTPIDEIRWSASHIVKTEKSGTKHLWDVTVGANGVTRRRLSARRAVQSGTRQRSHSKNHKQPSNSSNGRPVFRKEVAANDKKNRRGQDHSPRGRRPPDSLARYLPTRDRSASSEHCQSKDTSTTRASRTKSAVNRPNSNFQHGRDDSTRLPPDPIYTQKFPSWPVGAASHAYSPGKASGPIASSHQQSCTKLAFVSDPSLPPEPKSLKNARSPPAPTSQMHQKRDYPTPSPKIQHVDSTLQRVPSPPTIWGDVTRTMVPCATRFPTGFRPRVDHSQPAARPRSSFILPNPALLPPTPPPLMTPQLPSVSPIPWGDNTRTIVPIRYETPPPSI